MQDKEKNEKILKESARIVNEVLKGNWSILTELVITQMMQGMNRPIGRRDVVVRSAPNSKEVIAKVRDDLLKKNILSMKYEGKGYDVLEEYGEENGYGHSSCLAPMRFDLGIIARRDLSIELVLGGRELGLSSEALAVNFAQAYKLSHEKYLGYKARIKICKIDFVKYI